MPQFSLIEAKNVFLDPDFVHLLQILGQCLGDAQGTRDMVKLENSGNFTKFMLELKKGNVLEVRYEDLKSAF